MSSLYGSSILNLDLVLDYNNLINKPTIPQVGYTSNGRNFAVELLLDKMFVAVPEGAIDAATANALGGLKIGYTENGNNYPLELDGDNEAFVNVPAPAITVATANALGGLKIGYTENGNNYAVQLDGDSEAFVTVVKAPPVITPTLDALPEFTLTADKDINSANNTTFIFEDVNQGSSATTVYSQGITHQNNTNTFTINTSGQYVISYFLHADDALQTTSNSRIYGYCCIRKENSSGNLIYEYSVATEYLRNLNPVDDMVLCGTTSITFNAGERFKIRYYRLVSQMTAAVVVQKDLSNLRIERIKYIAT